MSQAHTLPPDETYMFCGFPVIFPWNHRPTANNKQPKTNLQTLGWEKWQRVRSCPATVFFFVLPAVQDSLSKRLNLKLFFWLSSRVPKSLHFIPKNRARTQDSAEQPLYLFYFSFWGLWLYIRKCVFLIFLSSTSQGQIGSWVFIHRTLIAPHASI